MDLDTTITAGSALLKIEPLRYVKALYTEAMLLVTPRYPGQDVLHTDQS